MNECTIIFDDGQKVLLHGDFFGVDFDAMESAALIAFVKSHLNTIKKLLGEGDTNERNC